MIGRSGKKWSGISVLAARQDDDEYIYIYIKDPREKVGPPSELVITINLYFLYMKFKDIFTIPLLLLLLLLLLC